MTGESQTMTRGHSSVEFWDNMSKNYDRHHDEKSRAHVAEMIDDLERRGFFAPGMRVLDIGCGTGRISMALADRGAEVTAFDFSKGMLDRLRETASHSQAKRITIVQGDWTALDLDRQGWTGAFDLSMAHMTPALRAPGGLERLIAASREHCFMKTWAAKHRSAILDEMWRMFTGTEPTPRRAPLIFMFNAIYAMGYDPAVEYDPIGWKQEHTVEELLDHYVTYARGMFDVEEAVIRERLTVYFEKIAVDGTITEDVTGRTGRLYWNVS